MRSDGISQSLQLPIDAVLPKRRFEGERIEEKVNVFGEPLDQVPTFGQACAAFQNRLIGRGLGDDSQRLCYVVVLLNDGRAEPIATKMLGRCENSLLEVGMFKELHANGAPSPARRRRSPTRRVHRNRTARKDSRLP